MLNKKNVTIQSNRDPGVFKVTRVFLYEITVSITNIHFVIQIEHLQFIRISYLSLFFQVPRSSNFQFLKLNREKNAH